jgi:hypothetical protein
MDEKPLQLIKRPNLVLREAQESLYVLICQKLKANEPITYEEAQKIYFEKSCRMMYNGWPHYCWYGKKDDETENTHHYSRLSDDNVKWLVANWLTSNIGKLVMNGALKIIPQIELT